MGFVIGVMGVVSALITTVGPSGLIVEVITDDRSEGVVFGVFH